MKMPSKTLIIKYLIFFVRYEDDKWQCYNVEIIFPVFPILINLILCPVQEIIDHMPRTANSPASFTGTSDLNFKNYVNFYVIASLGRSKVVRQ